MNQNILKHTRLKISEVSNKVITLEPENTLLDARNTLLRYNISRIVIARDNRAVGIITEKDISRILYTEPQNRQFKEIRLEEIMNKDLIEVNEEKELKSCAKLMLEHNVSSLLVLDDDRLLKGIVTKSDLVHSYAMYYAHRKLVEDVVQKYMTKKVLTVDPEEPIHMALMLMTDNKVSRVVVTRNRRPVGIITGRDLLPISLLSGTGINGHSWHVSEQTEARRREQIPIPSGIKAIFLVMDVMKYDPITITNDSDLSEAAHIMMRNRISGIPVVDSDNILAGIITKTDIVKRLASDN
ncbi:MAG TPA: CBS domain-containing protein [Nitrososphaeraceae archaeon]